jgi:hypothetical protein
MKNKIRKGSSVMIQYNNRYGGKTGKVLSICSYNSTPTWWRKNYPTSTKFAGVCIENDLIFEPVVWLILLRLVKDKSNYWAWKPIPNELYCSLT